MGARGCVVVFTKPARPGRVKTRLIGELTAEQTARLHQAFLDDLLERLGGSAHDVWLAWALDEGEAPPRGEVPVLRQEGRDLGERLYAALSRAAESHLFVAAVGSDHPEMPARRLDEAFDRLSSGADVVLGPADDGGYYLVATRRGRLDRRIFEQIPWSTERVLEETLERCARAGLQVELLAQGHDVDTPDDLPRLGAYLERNPEACPRTRILLQQWGLAAAG